MGQKADIIPLAYNLARNSIVDPGPFNPQIAKDSLLIFINAGPNRQHVSAAVAVLNALDELNAIIADDRRSRIWKERKLAVQVAFERSPSSLR
jgi:hypothetical protein